jgi:hypothetical protein
MVIKRKRRRIEDGLSDEEEDPYTLINIEGICHNKKKEKKKITTKRNQTQLVITIFYYKDILSPIELPTDIVRRPALKRILRSRQIDTLARTSMEFIEGEKNFNKILCRLSAIMNHDDPRYLDLTFDRTLEQRKKYKEDAAAAAEAAATLSGDASKQNSMVEPLDPKLLDSEIEASLKEDIKMDEDEDVDTEAREVVKRVKELLLVHSIITIIICIVIDCM